MGYLSAVDSPDGYCPTSPSEDRRRLDQVRHLFYGAEDARNAPLWLSAGEIATVALIGIAAVLLVFILIRKVGSLWPAVAGQSIATLQLEQCFNLQTQE